MKYKTLLTLTLSTIGFFPVYASTSMIDPAEVTASSLAKPVPITITANIISSTTPEKTTKMLLPPSSSTTPLAINADQEADNIIDTVTNQLAKFNITGTSVEEKALTFIMNVMNAAASGNKEKVVSIFLEAFENIVNDIKNDAIDVLLKGNNPHQLVLSDFKNIKITSLSASILKFNLVFSQNQNVYEIPEQIHLISISKLKDDIENIPVVTKSIFKHLFPCFIERKTA